MPFFDDPRLFYEDHNPSSQRTVLLLHGLGANSASWQLQVPVLVEAGYRVIVPDAPGFGRSPYRSGANQAAQVARALAALLQRLQCAPATVVGVSMGGTHALQLALDYPRLVERLVLVNTFSHLRPRSLNSYLYFAWRFVLVHSLGLQAQGRFVAQRIFPGEGQAQLRELLVAQISQADVRGYRAAMRALARFNVSQRLGELHLPVLVVTGSRDSTVSPEYQTQMAAQIPGAVQRVLQDAGHAAPVEQFEAFNELLLGFLSEARQPIP